LFDFNRLQNEQRICKLRCHVIPGDRGALPEIGNDFFLPPSAKPAVSEPIEAEDRQFFEDYFLHSDLMRKLYKLFAPAWMGL
jgi:hypothetical protein